jgi:hypothetical protein
VYVHVKDGLGNTLSSSAVTVASLAPTASLFADATAPTFSGVPELSLTAVQRDSSGIWYVKAGAASLTFTATDGNGIGGMEFAVTTDETAPNELVIDANGIGGWAVYTDSPTIVDLTGFAENVNIKELYVHVKDALDNTLRSDKITSHSTATELYVDKTAPAFTVGGDPSSALEGTKTLGQDGTTYYVKGASVTLTAGDGTGVAGIEYAVISSGKPVPDEDDWTPYSSGPLEVPLTKEMGDIQKVKVYLKDALGNTITTPVELTLHSGSTLMVDGDAPEFSVPADEPAETLTGSIELGQDNVTSYVKGASVSFKPTDAGIGLIKYAVRSFEQGEPTTAGDWITQPAGSIITVPLTKAMGNIKTVTVYLKDILDNAISPPVELILYASDLKVDGDAPTAPTVDPATSTVVNNTTYYTVASAKITFTPTDGTGVGGIKYVVLLSEDPSLASWLVPVTDEVEVDLSSFIGNIQTVYLYLKDALENVSVSIPVEVHATGPLYIDQTPPLVSGTPVIDSSTGNLTGITISDLGTYAAGFELLNSWEIDLPGLSLAGSGPYTISGMALPTAGSDLPYTIKLTVRDKGGVEKSYVTEGTISNVAGVYSGLFNAWASLGSPTIPQPSASPFSSPFSAPMSLSSFRMMSAPVATAVTAATAAASSAPALEEGKYGTIGGVRYPIVGLWTAPLPAPVTPGRSSAQVPRSSPQAPVRVPVSYANSYGNEDPEYLHAYGITGRSGTAENRPAALTVVQTGPASTAGRPNRAPALEPNAASVPGTSETGGTAASGETAASVPGTSKTGGTTASGEAGPPLLSALPAALPADSPDAPADKVPAGHSELYPAVLPPSGEDTGKRRRLE